MQTNQNVFLNYSAGFKTNALRILERELIHTFLLIIRLEFGDRSQQPSTDARILQPSTGAKTLLNLNDDCLHEVFRNLDIVDLFAVADVCSSLRKCVQDYLEISKFRFLELGFDYDNEYLFKRSFSKTVNLMRRIGSLIVSLRCWWRNEFIKLLVQYSSSNLVELHLMRIDITDEIAQEMKPLFRHLRKIKFHSCAFGEFFWETLPSGSQCLEKLEFIRPRRLYSEKRRKCCFTALHC